MRVLDYSEISKTVERLLSEFLKIGTDQARIDKSLSIVDLVDTWKYSKAEYFQPIPYGSEMEGRSRGKLLKKVYDSPYEGSAKGNYCFGFLDGNHVATMAPSTSLDDPKELTTYIHEKEVLRYMNTVHYRRTAKNAKLLSVGEFFSLGDVGKVNIAAGKDKFYIYLYSYNSFAKIGRVTAYSKTWGREIQYEFNYDGSGELSSINSEGQLVWKAV